MTTDFQKESLSFAQKCFDDVRAMSKDTTGVSRQGYSPVETKVLEYFKKIGVELNLEIFIYMNILLIDGFPIKFPGVPLFDLDFLRDKLRIRNITGHGVVLEHGVEQGVKAPVRRNLPVEL